MKILMYRILVLFLFLLVYSFALRPLIFFLHENVFVDFFGLMAGNEGVGLGVDARFIFYAAEGIRAEWGIAFGYITFVIPTAILWLLADIQKCVWVLYLHAGVLVLSAIIFVFAVVILPAAGMVNSFFYTIMLPGVAYVIVALSVTEFLKKRKTGLLN